MSSQTIFITNGSTNVSIDVGPILQDAGATSPGDPLTGLAYNSSGLVCYYREGGTGTVTQLTLATQTVGGAHSDGGFVQLDATNMPGMYRLDLSDAMCSGSNAFATITLAGNADMASHTIHMVKIVPANVEEWLGTAAATPSTAGVPEVDVTYVSGTSQTARDLGASVLLSPGTGTGQVSLSSGAVTAGTVNDKTGYRLSSTGIDDIFDEALSGHTTTGSFGQAMYISRANTAQAGAASTITLDASASSTDDFYNNNWIFITGGTGAGQGNTISDYNGTTKVATVQDSWATNPSSDSEFCIVPRGGVPGASAPTAAAVADAVWDEARSDHTSEGTFGALLYAPHEGTAQAGTSASITLDATGSSSTDDFYNYAFIKIIAGTGAGQSRQISDYNGTTKVATVSLNWTTTPSTDSQYVVMTDFGIDAATVAAIADQVWDEARSAHQTAGSFGEYVLADSTRVSGSTSAADGLESAVSGATPLPANVTQISGDSTAADNLESYTDGTTAIPANMTEISGDSTAADNLEAAFDGTGGVTVSANLDGYAEVRASGGSAGKNASELVTDILTTQMTEAYNTDGTAPTLAQALFVIMQRLTESEVSGTTLTVKQLDGSTAAYTLTLDDGTNPTSETRAT